MLESNMSKNRLFMVCTNVAGVFTSLMGIMTHLYKLYLMKKAVFGISSSVIQHCQYPLQKLIDVKYFPSSPAYLCIGVMGMGLLL